MSASNLVYVLIVSKRFHADQVQGIFLDLDVALETTRDAIRKRFVRKSRDDLEKLIASPQETTRSNLGSHLVRKSFEFEVSNDYCANVVQVDMPSTIQAKSEVWLIVTPCILISLRLELQSIHTSYGDAMTEIKKALAKFVAKEKSDAVILHEPLSSEILAKYNSIEIPTSSEDDYMRWDMPSAYGNTDTWISMMRFTVE